MTDLCFLFFFLKCYTVGVLFKTFTEQKLHLQKVIQKNSTEKMEKILFHRSKESRQLEMLDSYRPT